MSIYHFENQNKLLTCRVVTGCKTCFLRDTVYNLIWLLHDFMFWLEHFFYSYLVFIWHTKWYIKI